MDESSGRLASTSGCRSWHDLEAQLAAFQDNGSPPMTAASSTETVSTNDQDVHEYDEEWDLSGRRASTAAAEREDGSDDDYDSDSAGVDGAPTLEEQSKVYDQVNPDLAPVEQDSESTWTDAPEQSVDQHIDTESEEEHEEVSNGIGESEDGNALALSVTMSFAEDEPSILNESPLSSRTSSSISSLKTQRSKADLSCSEPAAATAVVSRRIQVLVRIRPLTKAEEGTTVVTLGSSPNVLRVQSGLAHSSGSLVTECAFDHVFIESATQEDVFTAVQPSIQAALSGYNATVFAYGQTGTGKTHTIFGSDNLDPSFSDTEQAKATWGIIPRALAYLLAQATLLSSDTIVDFQLSFMQIYNDRLFDLLTDRRKQKPLLIREQPSLDVLGATNVILQGLSSERFTTLSEALQVLRRGRTNRCVRETEANASSSRSHAIVQINISTELAAVPGQEIKRVRRSRLNLVDLAGSEKWNTELEMEDCHSLELKNINTSLSALGNCIAALAEPGRKHIPYRDSTLTRVLQDSFGGNTQASLIATISSHQRASEETIRTLQFADRARSVMQVVRVNESVHGSSELLVAKAQIVKLRERLEYEQKRRQETRRKEFDAMQREFLETIQVKDKEIQKLARGNSDLMKSRDEDTKKIQALRTRLQEMETLLQSASQSHSSNNTDARPETSAEVVERRSSLTLPSPVIPKVVIAPLMPMKKTHSKTSLNVKENARKEEAPRNGNGSAKSYKYLLERYALGSKHGQQRSTEQTQRLPPTSAERGQIPTQAPIARSIQRHSQPLQAQPSPVHSKNQSQHLAVEPSTPWKSAFQANSGSENAGSCPEEPRRSNAFREQYPTSVLPAVTDFAATTKERQQTTMHSAAQSHWLEAMAAASKDAALKKQAETTPAPSWMGSRIQKEISTWLHDANHESYSIAAAGATAGAPATSTLVAPPQSSGATCEKHRLKGCVLCAASVSAAPPIASIFSSSSGFRSLAKRDAESVAPPSTVVDEESVPCMRHRLTQCCICSKTTTMAPSRSITALPLETVKQQQQLPTQAASFSSSESIIKCAAHALTNCVLCAGGKSASNNSLSSSASMPSSLLSSSLTAAVRFTLDDRSFLWTQSQEPRVDSFSSFTSSASPLLSSAWSSSSSANDAVSSSSADIVRKSIKEMAYRHRPS